MLVVLVACGLLLASAAWAQNTDNPFQPYDRDASTLILYHFDEDGGGIEPNEGPPALAGNITGGRWVPTGRFGGGLAMDGATRIDPSRTTSFTGPDLTMEAWVYQTRREGAVFLIDATGNDDDGSWGRLLAIDVNGRPFALAIAPYERPSLALSPDPIPLNEWTHVAGLWSESTNQILVAVNGVSVGGGFLAVGQRAWNRVTIGRSQSIPDPRGLFGVIDEVRISPERRFLQPVRVDARSWSAIKALY